MVSSSCRRSLPWISVVALAAALPAFAGKEFLAGPREKVAVDELLVGLRSGAAIGPVAAAVAPQAAITVLSRKRNTYLLKLPHGRQAAISRLLAAHPWVSYVEPNRIRSITVGPPNDTSLTRQWNLTAVQAQQAWNFLPDRFLTAATAGTDRVKVAILDTGADCTHPDFMNAGGTSTDAAQGGQLLWSASEAIQATTIASPACPWEDDYGHGTHVAGILAAATNNGAGVASLGFPLQLIIIKTNGSNGNATDAEVAQGILDAISAGADVISMSLGGAGYSQTLQMAMDEAWENNVLVVAAAGNTGDNTLIFPGDGNHALAVAATDGNSAVASFSSFGEWVKIAAPGVNIYSTLPSYTGTTLCCNYGSEQGTSMATPHVAALAGLLYAANPGISAAEVAQRIQRTAQSLNAGWDQKIGYGIINAGAAMANISAPFTQGALTGQVVDDTGAPVTGAVVTAGTQSYTTALDAKTGDDDGLFRLNLDPGSYTVTATFTDSSTPPVTTQVSTQAAVVAGADTMLTLRLNVPVGEFTGTVTHNGVAVADAVVAAISNNLIQGTAISDVAGNYTITAPAGTYTLVASAANYLDTASGSEPLTANGHVTVNLALTALGTIGGAVTDLNGSPVPNANVQFTGAISGGATTAADGTYSTIGLPAGTYSVTASASGFADVTVANVAVTNNNSTLVNLQFSTGVALTSGLVAYWPFNEGTGLTAFDQSGNGFNATLQNTNWTSGLLFPSALQLNVNESYAIMQSTIPFAAPPFSASVWVNSTASELAWSTLVQASTSAWYLGLDSTGKAYKFSISAGAGSTGTCSTRNISQGCAQGGTVSTGWHLVTGTYDGTNALLYVDQSLVASDTFTHAAGSSKLTMGVNWGGVMQSVRIYNRALTEPEIAALYSQGSPTTLTLSKTADAAAVSGGNAIGYTLIAKNTGTSTAQLTTINDPLPTGTGVVWSISPAYGGPGTCAIASGTLNCTAGALAAGATVSVHVSGATTSASCGVYSNTATVSASNAAAVQASASTSVQCTQTISFAPLADQNFGAAPFTVSATASSNLPVSFDSLTTSVCTISGATVTLAGIGTCTIEATQAGSSIYSAASPVDQSFLVKQGSQTINFAALADRALGSGTFTVTATATSGLAVSFSPQTTAGCTMSGATVTLVAAGTCTIRALQAGNADWAAAAPVNQSFLVTAGMGTASVNGLTFPNTVVGKASATQKFSLQNSGNSALTISSIGLAGADAGSYRYTADGTSPCPLSPATLAANASCTLDIAFVPASPGAHNSAQIAVVDNSGNVPGTTQSISLAGTGIVLSSIAITANSPSLAYGASEAFTATGTYSDNSTAGLTTQVAWASSVAKVAGIDANGLASALQAGQTNITAGLNGVTSNTFQLTVVAGAAANIAVSAGSGQSATAGTAFSGTLQALVKDGGGDVVPNVSVTFTAPANGAGGTFSNGLAVFTATTNSAGVATSSAFTANSMAGAYTVSAAVAGVGTPAGFSLTNLKAPVLTVSASAATTFMQGHSASYTITVANAATAGVTSGTFTVTESLPGGLTLTALSGGATWSCVVASATCTRSALLNPGDSSTITAAVAVAFNAPPTVSDGVSVAGGASAPSSSTTSTTIVSACAITQGKSVSVTDVQSVINQALGIDPAANDLTGDGVVNVVDLQIVTNAALGGTCKAS